MVMTVRVPRISSFWPKPKDSRSRVLKGEGRLGGLGAKPTAIFRDGAPSGRLGEQSPRKRGLERSSKEFNSFFLILSNSHHFLQFCIYFKFHAFLATRSPDKGNGGCLQARPVCESATRRGQANVEHAMMEWP